MKATMKRPRRGKHGISNVIVVMLSLVLVVIVVANVVSWSQKMSQLDWERSQEKVEIEEVRVPNLVIDNKGSLTVHIVSLWIIDANQHKRYDTNFFINAGENSTYTLADTGLPTGGFLVKVVTERGNIAIYTKN